MSDEVMTYILLDIIQIHPLIHFLQEFEFCKTPLTNLDD